MVMQQAIVGETWVDTQELLCSFLWVLYQKFSTLTEAKVKDASA